MALFPCLQGGGSSSSETTLWTNPSPTSELGAQTITLSDNISNYRYIKFVFNASNTTSEQYEVIFSVNTITNAITGNGKPVIGINSTQSTGQVVTRRVIYVSDTSLQIMAVDGGYNNRSIITAIKGVS